MVFIRRFTLYSFFQTASQTEWITCYKLRVDRGLEINIIDTPGIDDTRGKERDDIIMNQIKTFFLSEEGIDLNAVCFVTQSSLQRLTKNQQYIFDSILSNFGKDVAEHIIVMRTFADGETQPVLQALSAAKVPYIKDFPFNNIEFFMKNRNARRKQYWDMNQNSYKQFFSGIKDMRDISLRLSNEVLKEREKLHLNVASLTPAVEMRLKKMEEIRQCEVYVQTFEKEINAGKSYFMRRTKPFEANLPSGTKAFNCLDCRYTCQYPCISNADMDEEHCVVKTGGKCRICPNECPRDRHQYETYQILHCEEKYRATLNALKERYMSGKSGKLNCLAILSCIKKELNDIKIQTVSMITMITECVNRLRKIALKPNTSTEVEYIELLIKSETQQNKPGHEDRVKILYELKEAVEKKTAVPIIQHSCGSKDI